MFARPHRYRRSTCISRRRKKTADQFDDPSPGWHPSRAKDRAPEGELQTRSDQVRLYFRSARRCPNRLRSPQPIRACELAPPADRCRGREPARRPPRRGQTNLSHLYDRPDPVRPADIQLSSCPFRLPVRARSTHSSNCVSSKGLAKNPIAPALIACSRIRSSGNAVMKIIGVVLP